jgi:serine/threonine protein kinase
MASLDHPNIVKLHKTFECNYLLIVEGDWYFLVMEYCDMGNLYNFQNKLNSKNFSK